MAERLGDADLTYKAFDDRAGPAHNLVIGLVRTRLASPGVRVRGRVPLPGLPQPARGQRGRRRARRRRQPSSRATHCDRVLVGDPEELDFEVELGGERFDAIVFVEVLEHVRNPGIAPTARATLRRRQRRRPRLDPERRTRQRPARPARRLVPVSGAGTARRGSSALLHPRGRARSLREFWLPDHPMASAATRSRGDRDPDPSHGAGGGACLGGRRPGGNDLRIRRLRGSFRGRPPAPRMAHEARRRLGPSSISYGRSPRRRRCFGRS